MALTDTFVRQVKWKDRPAGEKHADAGNLYLLVKPAGKYWRMDYAFAGKRKTLALGVYPAVSLALARQKRDRAKGLLAHGIDPGTAKREEKQAQAEAAANTFEAVATEWLGKTAADRKPITQAKVTILLDKDVIPFIGHLPIASIKPKDLLDMVLRKLEARGAIDTAHRVRQLCGQVFRYAVATGRAERDIAADLRGALAAKQETHYAAVTEPKALGALMRAIHGYVGLPVTVAALKLSALTFVRPGELRAAKWEEIDLDAREWRIAAARMKMGVAHIVPLSDQALEILEGLKPLTGHGRFVFPSVRTGERPMSENTVNAALRSLGYSTEMHTAHGFRATARTILDEVLGERVDLIEHQLAHEVKDPNGRAYNRTAHLPARRDMMQRWADYLDKQAAGAEVIPIRPAA